MRRVVKLSLIMVFFVCVAFGGVGCGGGGGTPIFESTVPTWIRAAWSGGTTGEPNTYVPDEATEWNGSMCWSGHIELSNYGEEFEGLNITNNCFIPLMLHTCAGEEQPGLPECAGDPFETPYDDLDHRTIDPGDSALIETNETLSINIFYCSDEMQLGQDTPLRCIPL